MERVYTPSKFTFAQGRVLIVSLTAM